MMSRAAAVLLLVTAAAQAQPADPDMLPADPDAPLATDSELPAGYPRNLVERPLALPSGMVEGTVALIGGRAVGETVSTIGPHVRYGIAAFELEAGVRLGLTGGDRLGAVLAAARFVPSPDMTVGLQLVAAGLLDDPRILTPRLTLGRKQQLTETVAAVSQVAPGIERTTAGSMTTSAYVATGQLRLQLTLAPHHAIEGRAALQIRHEDGVGTDLAHDYGVQLVSSITPTLDLAPGVDVAFDDGEIAVLATLAVSLRNR